MTQQNDLYNKVIEGDNEAVQALTLRAMEAGANPEQLLNEVLIPAMAEVGRRFEQQEFYVPEMLIAARAMKAGVEILRPMLTERGIEPIGTVVMGSVAGDLHDIGKNLVAMMLEGSGFRVIDLGVDVSADQFVQAIRDYSPQIVGMSALLTTTMMSMKVIVEALERAGLRSQVTVMIGGAPVTQRFADEIGADLYAPDASSAARGAKGAVLRC
jgi:5-methyltetrahydrofolate--homocysteine methyltransferase